MMSEIMRDLLWSGAVLAASALLILVPLKILAAATVPFSMKTFGIRKVRRWHSRTDTLGNLMLWISVLFCIAAPWIPYAPIIYLVWLTFTWLCTLSRAVRLSQVKTRWIKLVVIFLISVLFGIAVLAGSGFYNHFALWIRSYLFAGDVLEGKVLDFMYFLNNVQPAAYLVQTIVLIFPLVCLWGQFKYMRLENTFKASNIGMYVFKSLLSIVFLFALGVFGNRAVEKIYQTASENQMSSEQSSLPLSREDLARRMLELQMQQQEQPASEQQPSEQPQPETPPEAVPSEQPAEGQPAPEEQPVPEQQPVPEEQPVPEAAPEIYYDEYGNAYDAAGNLIVQ